MSEGVNVAREGILPLFNSVRERRLEPELMDSPNLDPKLHEEALRGLKRINALSATAEIVWKPIRALARAEARPIRVLDLASGGGDCVLALSRFAVRHGLDVEVHGCDVSPRAVEYANRRAEDEHNAGRFFVSDVLNDAIPPGYDAIFCSLFAHHLRENEVEKLLISIRAANPKLVVVNDLIRCTTGFILAQAVCRILTRSYVVHYDGPRSVAAAFTMDEFAALANRAGLNGHRIVWSWPFRFLFSWKST